ncbi:hypothetical protein UC317_0662 [Lactococcus lactis subsp. lactis]|nr:hypothetical protein UC317_0662 [Lactococcus lactis subsp. lactis]
MEYCLSSFQTIGKIKKRRTKKQSLTLHEPEIVFLLLFKAIQNNMKFDVFQT